LISNSFAYRPRRARATVTRHSNLRDVQLLFHLMGTKPPKRAKVGKSELVKTHAQALEGLRQVRAL
jgi:hypothetical protein